VYVKLRYIQVDRSAGSAYDFGLHSEGGIPSPPARSYLYCTPSFSSVDYADIDTAFVVCRTRTRGTFRLRTHCHLRLWISETTRVPGLLCGPFLNRSTPLLRLHTPKPSFFSGAIPKGLRLTMGPITHFTIRRTQPRPRVLTAALPPHPRNRSFHLPPRLSPFVGHSGLCHPLARVCIFFFGSSSPTGCFDLVVCTGVVGNVLHTQCCSVHKVPTIAIHMHMYSSSGKEWLNNSYSATSLCVLDRRQQPRFSRHFSTANDMTIASNPRKGYWACPRPIPSV